MTGESDILGTFFQSHFLDHAHDTFNGTRFLFGSFMPFQFQDEAGLQFSGFIQILPQGGELFAIIQLYGGTYFSVAFCMVTPLKVSSWFTTS